MTKKGCIKFGRKIRVMCLIFKLCQRHGIPLTLKLKQIPNKNKYNCKIPRAILFTSPDYTCWESSLENVSADPSSPDWRRFLVLPLIKPEQYNEQQEYKLSIKTFSDWYQAQPVISHVPSRTETNWEFPSHPSVWEAKRREELSVILCHIWSPSLARGGWQWPSSCLLWAPDNKL